MAQHRRHPADGREQRRVGRLAARGEALAQRQQVEQQLDEGPRIAADVAAVGEDLALQLRHQQLLRLRQLAIVAGDAQVGVDEADQGEQTRIAVGRIAPGGGEIGDLLGQAAHDGGVGAWARRHRAAGPACDSQERTRRPTTSGSHACSSRPLAAPDPFADELRGHRPCLAGSAPPRGGAASRSRAARAPRPGSGGATANGERPRSLATLPARPKLPAATSSAKLASCARRSGGASSSSSAAGER